MSLPKRPPLNQPIPNADIPNTPTQYSVKAPYWDAIVSGDLAVTEDGKLEIQGSTALPLGEVEVQGEYWSMPLGNGLGVWRGEFRNVEPEFPPYGCRTDVITTGVTDFTDAWRDCAFTSFPGDIDTSAGTNFTYSWAYTGLSSFPQLDVSSGSVFYCSWYNCESLVTFPELSMAGAQDLSYAWQDCSSLRSFLTTDLGSSTVFHNCWQNCVNLSSFPEIDCSSGVDFSQAWSNCSSLTSFPTLNVSSGENFAYTWSYCSSLTSFPQLNLDHGTAFYSTWYNCTSLVSFPAGMFDNSSATQFDNAWDNCALSQQSVDNILISIDTAGQINGTLGISGGTSSSPSNLAGWNAVTSLEEKGWTVTVNGNHPGPCDEPPYGCNTNVNPYCVTNFAGAWGGCSSLTSFPLLDVSAGTNFNQTWINCASLTSFPTLDVSSGTVFSSAWSGCSSLTSFPTLDVGSGTYFGFAWQGCSSLTSFPALDFSSGEDFDGSWMNCTSLTYFPPSLFDNFSGGAGSTSFIRSWTNCALSQQSVDNILVSLNKSGQVNNTLDIDGGTSSAPGPAGLAAKASLQAKGWTVATN